VTGGRWFYIGGSPCAGKSTVADLVARRHGLDVFHCDDTVRTRHDLVTRAASPALHELTSLTTCGRLGRDPGWQAEKEVLYYREQFPFLLEELRAVTGPVVVEGADLLPELMRDHLGELGYVVWMVPTPEFQLEHYRRREWAHALVAECDEPGQAFGNWMRRDMLFAEYVRATATQLGGTVVEVDGSRSVAEVASEVGAGLGLH
jgi:2-phosphoglycerate kinase